MGALSASRPAAHWFTAAGSSGLFPNPRSEHLSTDLPSNFEIRDQALFVPLLQSSFVPNTHPELLAPGPPAWVSALIATSPGASTLTRVPRPSLRSAHELSQLLGGFLHAPASRACFIPQPRPGFVRVQGLLPRCSQAFSSKVVAPMPFQPEPSPTNLGCQVRARRLRGLHPHRGAFRRPGFSRNDSRFPPHVPAPPGPPLFAFRPGLPGALRS
jgi:hypothetical protein